MCPDSIVEIPEGSGNNYRYRYNPESGKSEYLGPVGDSPEIAETEFLAMMTEARPALTDTEWDDLIRKIEDYRDRVRDYDRKITRKERDKMVINRELVDLRDAKMKDEAVLSKVYYKKIMETYQDPEHWKNPIPRFRVPNLKAATVSTAAIAAYHGGAEFDISTMEVWSKGYNVYTGEVP
jgi:hypothetical protein